MNTPNPLIPQGSLQQQSQGKSNVRIAVFTILTIHVALLGGLLIQGCKPEKEKTQLSTMDTNPVTPLPPLSELSPLPPANPPVTPATNPPVVEVAPVPPLVVEPPTPTFNEYTVAKGDTFSTIAKNHGVSLKSIEQANPGVSSTKLKVGQKLLIHGVSNGTSINSPPPAVTAANGDVISYTVKPGDNLTKIARAHGTTLKAVRALNNMKSDSIRAGQKLKLPAGKNPSAEPAPATVTPAGAPQ